MTYQGIKNFVKSTIAAGGLVAVLDGCSNPVILENKDLTGDDIPDILLGIEFGIPDGTWLYIGQEDGTFIRAELYKAENIRYFITDDEQVYFFNGEHYVLSPQSDMID